MKVAIYGRNFDLGFKEYVKRFFEILNSNNIEIIIYKKFFDFLKKEIDLEADSVSVFSKHFEIKNDVDLLFSIGGDGTILDAITIVRDSGIPIVGLNTGRLGFLASISKDEIETALKAIFAKEYTIDVRSLLKLESSSGLFNDFPFSLNEIAIQKVDSAMITVHAYIDGEFLNSYWSDGLLVSTPTGSTAYSLSVGGPIIVPQSGNFIISPISPHNLTVRPIVLRDSSRLQLKLEGRSLNYILSLDHRSLMIKNTEEIFISKAEFKVKLIKLNNNSFYKTLRNKLMWGIDKRN
ncbi:MAG: NAD kinase [Bacteroidales bacterium]|jgi:NAD+ kinase|nr:NAD kinase [Bacteroidales bacterium]